MSETRFCRTCHIATLGPKQFVCEDCRVDQGHPRHRRSNCDGSVTRAKRRAKGVCVFCGRVPPREGKQSCQGCADRIAAQKSGNYELMRLTYLRQGPRHNARPDRFTAKPHRMTHIAGYVPPKGSIAAMFLGHVVAYH